MAARRKTSRVSKDDVAYSEEENLKFVDLVLYAWACWTGKGTSLDPTQTGVVLGVVSSPELARYQLPLSEDQFLLVDKRYAQLAPRLKRAIEIEYFNEPDDAGRRLVDRKEWKPRIKAAQLDMYNLLKPDIEGWRP